MAKVIPLFKSAPIATLSSQAHKLLDDQKFVDAERLFNLILEQDPNHTPTLGALGYLEFQRRNFTAAEHYWFKTLLVDPKCSLALYNLGFSLWQRKGMCWQVVTYFTLALEEDPSFADAHLNLALSLLELQVLPEKAEKHLKKFLELEPEGKHADQARLTLRKFYE